MLEERTTISYCISGLAARDQIVFKSLMRLLSPRLSHAWVYEPKGELAVVSDPPTLSDSLSLESHRLAIEDAQTLLSVGTNKNNGVNYLRLPIQANVMEVQLNAIGAEIAAARLADLQQAAKTPALQNMPTQPSDLSLPEALTQEQPLNADYLGSVSLKRWPSKNLLRNTAQIRMATILLRPQTTLPEFLKLSGQPPQVCLQFLQELRSFEFLKLLPQTPTAPTAIASAAQTLPLATATQGIGLLSRIRRRLGI